MEIAKPSRHDAATSQQDANPQLANAQRPEFQFTLNHDKLISSSLDETMQRSSGTILGAPFKTS
jgi:hypothetical protein